MNCIRCYSARVLRTREHDELSHFKQPFACVSCGLVFGPEDQARGEQVAFPFAEETRKRPVILYQAA